jgi:hypothetical protein
MFTQTMFTNTAIALSVATVLGVASAASAKAPLEACSGRVHPGLGGSGDGPLESSPALKQPGVRCL